MAEQKIEITDELVSSVAAKVFDKIGKEEAPSRKYFSDAKLQEKYENAEKIWTNNGFENQADQYDPTKKDQKIGFKELCDALSTPDASILIGKVVSNIVKEAIEPLLVGTSLLHTIRFSAGQQITFPAAGAFTAEDIPEGGEYPERKLEVAGTVNIVAVLKSHLIGLDIHDIFVDNKAEGVSHRERLNDETLEFSDVIVRSAW